MTDKPAETDAPKKKGKKKLLIALVLLVLAVGGGAGFYATKSGMLGSIAKAAEPTGPQLVPKAEQKRAAAGEGGEGHGDGEGAKSGGVAKPPSGSGGDEYASNYYAMDKEFTSNLQDSTHLVQIGIAVSTPYDDSVIDNLKTNDIAVRSAILMALGDTTEDQVFTTDGKQRLQVRITRAINDTLKQKEGFGGISNTYFTSFVVQ